MRLLASVSLAEALPSRRAAASNTPKTQVRAALADLRFLQGVLASLTEEAEGSSLEPYEEHLYRFAGARSVLAKVADEIEAQLGPWRGEKSE